MRVLGGALRVKGPHAEWPALDNVLTLITLLWFFGICWRLARDGYALLGEFVLYLLVTSVFIQLCKYFFGIIGGFVLTQEAAEKPRNIRKFADQGWQLVIHVSMSIVELWLLRRVDYEWYYDMDSDQPGGMWEPIDQKEDSVLNSFYLIQLSIWLTTAFSHRFFEARHKDYFVMYSHHVATITLIAWSWSLGALRVGFMVLLLHDTTDIMVDSLKLTNYAGLDEKSGLYLVEASFIINLITWLVGRLYLYPCYVVKATYDNIPKMIGRPYTEYDSFLWSLRGCLALLSFLVVLHCWWYFLILRMGYRLLIKSERAHEVGSDEYEGTSSDSEAEDESVSEKSKTAKSKVAKSKAKTKKQS